MSALIVIAGFVLIGYLFTLMYKFRIKKLGEKNENSKSDSNKPVA